MKRLLPDLWFSHRGYALVAFGLMQLHVISVLDHVLPGSQYRHDTVGWTIVNRIAPEWSWAVIHAGCAIMIIIGAYNLNKIALAQYAFAVSITTYLILGFSWGYVGVTRLGATTASSIIGIGISALVVFCCIAAVLEPPRNPETERDRG